MTPKMIQLFSHALQVCLNQKFYTTQEVKHASQYMCHALRYAMDAGELKDAEGRKAMRFLARWIRWQAHLLRVPTTTMCTVDRYSKWIEGALESDDWFYEGHGVACYQALIQRLEAKLLLLLQP